MEPLRQDTLQQDTLRQAALRQAQGDILPEAKELPLKNLNNCLACDAFNYITFAPARSITDADLEKVYYVKNGNEAFYCKIVDLYRCDFSRMPTIATIAATGMEAHEWALWWIEQHPETTAESKMVVYQYKKIKM